MPIDLEPKRCGRPSACNPKARPSDPFERHSWGYQFSKINRLKEFHLELETVEQKKNELDAIVARASGWELPLGDGNVLVLSSNKTTRTGWVGHPLGEIRRNSQISCAPGYQANFDAVGRKEEEKEFDRADDADETYIDPGTADQVAEGHIEDISQNVAAGAPELEQSADSQRAEAPSTLEPPPKPPSAKQRLVADSVRFIDEHLEPSVEDDSQRMTYYVVTLTWNATAAIHQDDR